MHDAQNIRLAALDRAITLHCSNLDVSREAADVVHTAEILDAFIVSGSRPAPASDAE